MKIYFAGTPGIRERDPMAEDNYETTSVILGYFTKSLQRSFRI